MFDNPVTVDALLILDHFSMKSVVSSADLFVFILSSSRSGRRAAPWRPYQTRGEFQSSCCHEILEMMDGNPQCRTDGSGVNPGQKKSVFDILLPMVSAQNCAIDGLQKSVMKRQKAVILPGSRGRRGEGHTNERPRPHGCRWFLQSACT